MSPAQPGLMLDSTWAQPGLNLGSFSNEPNVRKPAQFRVNVRPALNSRETSRQSKQEPHQKCYYRKDCGPTPVAVAGPPCQTIHHAIKTTC